MNTYLFFPPPSTPSLLHGSEAQALSSKGSIEEEKLYPEAQRMRRLEMDEGKVRKVRLLMIEIKPKANLCA